MVKLVSCKLWLVYFGEQAVPHYFKFKKANLMFSDMLINYYFSRMTLSCMIFSSINCVLLVGEHYLWLLDIYPYIMIVNLCCWFYDFDLCPYDIQLCSEFITLLWLLFEVNITLNCRHILLRSGLNNDSQDLFLQPLWSYRT